MYNLEIRVRRIVQELEKLLYPIVRQVRDMEIRRGPLPKATNPNMVMDFWEPYEQGAAWTMPGTDEYVLFRAKVVLSCEMAGKSTVILCRTNKEGWNAVKPQFLFYVDDIARQAFDTNHVMARLCENARSGDEYMLHFSAFGGLNMPGSEADKEPVKCFINIAVIDWDVWDLYYDLYAPLTHSKYLQTDSKEWSVIIEALNEACNIIDLRMPGSPVFHKSVLQARESLKRGLYDKPCCVLPAMVSCIGHTHIDVAWLWRYCHTREKTARTFTTVMSLMDEYPYFKFMSSQPQIFQFLKEDYPDIYERVKKRVLEGRFEVEGGMWVECDTNIPSGESLIRQLLHGKRFIREEFGMESCILWLPDVFGYSAALPQILKKSGINYFMTSKLKNNELNKMPHNTFLWKGIDGTGVLTQLTSYNPNFYNGQAQSCEMVECWKEYKDKNLCDDVLYTYGYGDGGGGPAREMVETIKRFEKGLPGATKTRFAKVRDFFIALDKKVTNNKNLTTWQGELYYEFHRGTYTSMAKNKRNNRKAEFLLANTEWASVLDNLILGGLYPYTELDSCWKTLLLNQFHDVLPGSSIKEVYMDTDELYDNLFKKAGRLLTDMTRHIAAEVNAPFGSLVVFNPLSWKRDTAVYFEAGEGKWALSDGKNIFPAQKCHNGRHVSLVRGIPSKGWLALQIVPGIEAGKIKATASSMENEFVRVRLDGNGNIKSMFDKKAGRETFRRGMAGNRIIAYEDKPHGEDNWNLDVFYTEKAWDISSQSIELIEQGPVRAVLQITRVFMSSTIIQNMILWQNSARIDFETLINWKDRDICLKAEFPVDVNAERATYEIQYGHLMRNTHANTSWDQAKFEVCAHKWADLSDNGFGMSLLNDCKYGHDALNGNLRITLLRSTCHPNPDADKEMHCFTYSIMPHAGDWRNAGTVRQAYEINVPVITVACIGGSLPPRFAFAEVSEENVILEVVKKAEDGNGIILRLYDAWNMSGTCRVKLFAEITSVEECDLMEKYIGNASFQYDTLIFNYRPFEIKTFRLVLTEV